MSLRAELFERSTAKREEEAPSLQSDLIEALRLV